MKLAFATSLVLAGALLVQGASAQDAAAGQCLAAVTDYVTSGQHNNDGVEWNDQAAYYVQNNAYADAAEQAEHDAEQAEYAISYNLQALAEALGMDASMASGAYLADSLGFNDNEEDRAMFASFYSLVIENNNNNNEEGFHASYEETFQQLLEYLDIDENEFEDEDAMKMAKLAFMDAYLSDAEGGFGMIGMTMAYDEELAESLGFNEDNEEGRATFASFYRLTYELVTNGDNYDCVDGDANNENANEDEEEDVIKKILANCQDLYEEVGIEINEIDEGNEAVEDLSLHIRMERAMTSDEFVIEDGNYEEAFQQLLEHLDIGEDEIEDEDATMIMAKIAFRDAAMSGALNQYLKNNAAYGQKIEDWEEVIGGFLESVGLEGDFNLENIDPSTAAYIYHQELLVEEDGCQKAMIAQFGAKEAAIRGFVSGSVFESSSDSASFLSAAMNYVKMTPGGVAGTVIAVAAVVGLVAYVIGNKSGKKKAEADAEAPHGYKLDDRAAHV